jgi:small subunit ribosomal protein S24e
MEIEIIEKQEQKLLKRTEIKYRALHPKESTPNRDAVRDELAKLLKAKKGNIVIDHQESQFGKSETIGYAKIYENAETVKDIERKHILKRNKLLETSEKKKTAPKAEEKPAEKTEEDKKDEKEAEPEKSEDKGE